MCAVLLPPGVNSITVKINNDDDSNNNKKSRLERRAGSGDS
jgi:hypothetical protein